MKKIKTQEELAAVVGEAKAAGQAALVEEDETTTIVEARVRRSSR